MSRVKSVKVLIMTGLLTTLFSCAYFNTFYNARKYYLAAEKEYLAKSEEKMNSALNKKFDTVIEKANTIIERYPQSKYVDNALYIVAMSYYYKGNYNISRKKFEEFANKYPQSELYAEAMVWYGRNLWKMNERELAFFQWKKIMNRTQDTYLLAQLYSLIGELYFNDSAYDSARTYYKKATEIGRSYDIAAESQYRIAEIDLAINRPAEAIKDLKKIDQFSPSLKLRDKMQVLLARIYRESRQYDEAINMINEKLNNPNNESVWGDLELQLGLIYLAQNDFESAQSRFSQIAEKYTGKPVVADAQYYLAELYMTYLHDYEKASKAYDAVVGLEKTSLRAFECRNISSEIKRFNTISKRLVNLTAQIESLNLNPKIANDTLQTVSDVVGKSPEEVKQNLEKKSTAAKKQVDTLAIFKEYYNSLYEIAEIYYFNFKQPDSAIIYLEKIGNDTLLNHLRTKAFYSLHRIYTTLNEKEKAAEYKAQLVQFFPESEYLAEIEKRPISMPPRETAAEELLAQAEEISQSNIHLAIANFDTLAKQYKDTKAGEKAVVNIAYLYHHKLFDLNNALVWYKYFIDTYPMSELSPMMRSSYDQLKVVEAAIIQASLPETTQTDGRDTPKQASGSQEPAGDK